MEHCRRLPLALPATSASLFTSSSGVACPPNQKRATTSGCGPPHGRASVVGAVSGAPGNSGCDSSSSSSSRHRAVCCLPRLGQRRGQPKALVGQIWSSKPVRVLLGLHLILLLVTQASGQQLLYNEAHPSGDNSNNDDYSLSVPTRPDCHHNDSLVEDDNDNNNHQQQQNLQQPFLHKPSQLQQKQNHLKSAALQASTTTKAPTKTADPVKGRSGGLPAARNSKQQPRDSTKGATSNNLTNYNYNYSGSPEEQPLQTSCDDCLAIPLVSIVGSKQINGFILGPKLQKRRQSVVGKHINNNNNEYNKLADSYKTSNNNNNNELEHSARIRHNLLPTALEPKSDEKCPMTKFMTVCDQIDSYPADVIISKLVGVKRVLKQSYFNLDSLFSDEREHSSEPFGATEPDAELPVGADDDVDVSSEPEFFSWHNNHQQVGYDLKNSDQKARKKSSEEVSREEAAIEQRQLQDVHRGSSGVSKLHPNSTSGFEAALINHIIDSNIDSKATTTPQQHSAAANYNDDRQTAKTPPRFPPAGSLLGNNQKQQQQQQPADYTTSSQQISPADEFVNLVERQAFSLGHSDEEEERRRRPEQDHDRSGGANNERRAPAGQTLANRLLPSRRPQDAHHGHHHHRRQAGGAGQAEQAANRPAGRQEGRKVGGAGRENEHLLATGAQLERSPRRHKRQIGPTSGGSGAQADKEEPGAAVGGQPGASLSSPAANEEDNDGPSADGSQNQAAEPICRAKSIYISPKAALNDKKQWKYVVNAPERNPQIRQIIRVDICEDPFGPCSDQLSLPFGFTSQCQQKYSKKKLLALDSRSGRLEVDTFFIPTCCVCKLIRDGDSVNGRDSQPEGSSTEEQLASAAGSDSYALGAGGDEENDNDDRVGGGGGGGDEEEELEQQSTTTGHGRRQITADGSKRLMQQTHRRHPEIADTDADVGVRGSESSDTPEAH